MKIIIWLVVSIICGLLYRAGGKGKPFNTKYRDLGCPLVAYTYLWFIGNSGLQEAFPLKIGLFLVAYGLTFGVLTTYWDFLFKEDNFYIHGFFVGLATIPCMFLGIHLYAIIIRTIILAFGMGLWSKIIGWDIAEEFGRGFLITATMPILII